MVAVVQVNLIVADIDRSREFYERIGVAFVPRHRTGDGPPEAWVSVDTGITFVLHSTGFASWWDESAPRPVPGGPQMDLEVASPAELDRIVGELVAAGATVVKSPADMPFGPTGMRFAIVLDPDGYRVGLKAPLA
ncbi:MAG: VOC family protein [Gordonia sp. (in: high G+C Gram-positive bacteria)]|uniref:VOC family protein n=1 Tax=Gordonia sp. (in: high G+C Gram-positive bacteria) TaxID=84139 RepID=UPI0039E50232